MVPATIRSENVARVLDTAQDFVDNELRVDLGGEIVTIPHLSVYAFWRAPEKGTLDIGYDTAKLTAAIEALAVERTDKPWNELYTRRGSDSVVVRQGREGVSFRGIEEAVLQASSIGPDVTDPQVALQKITTPYETLSLEEANPRIDVNLTTKRMTLLERGIEQAVFPISGGKEATPTPLGDYKITSKTRKMTMSGPGYFQRQTSNISAGSNTTSQFIVRIGMKVRRRKCQSWVRQCQDR